MDLNISSLEGQLTEIVQNNSSTPVPKAETVEIETSAPNPELIRLLEARKAGNEGEYLTVQTENMNRFVKELELDINFKVEISENGTYLVQVLDDNGDIVKTIPGEAFAETREKIKTQVKGLIEDSQN